MNIYWSLKAVIARHWPIGLGLLCFHFYLLCCAAILINLTYYAQNCGHHEHNNAYKLPANVCCYSHLLKCLIALLALSYLLCSKLCWNNQLVPSNSPWWSWKWQAWSAAAQCVYNNLCSYACINVHTVYNLHTCMSEFSCIYTL